MNVASKLVAGLLVACLGLTSAADARAQSPEPAEGGDQAREVEAKANEGRQPEAKPDAAEPRPEPEGLYDQGEYLSPYRGAEEGVPTKTSGAPLSEGEERIRPDLRNREEEPTTAGDVLIWVPRVLFYPVYLVTEYLVRWPLGVLTKAAERYHVIEWVDELTSWDDGNARILPALRINSGFEPALGFGIIWENMIWERNDWGLNFDYAAPDNLTFEIATRQRFYDDLFSVRIAFESEIRNDFVFYGIGAGTDQEDEARFFRAKNMGNVELSLDRTSVGIGGRAQLEASRFRFDCTTNVGDEGENICGSDNEAGTTDDFVDVESELPYFQTGYELGRAKGSVFYDSREPRPAPGDGIRIELLGRYGAGMGDDAGEIEFVRYGGKLGLFWDIWERRVLSLAGYVELAEPIQGRDIPFSELITMGGIDNMRGFALARFHGRSAFVGTLQYQYPVWSFFDGYIVAEVGNAFGPQFEDFDAGLLRGSLAFGFTTLESRYNSFDLLFALGSGPFERSFEVESARVAIGTHWGL